MLAPACRCAVCSVLILCAVAGCGDQANVQPSHDIDGGIALDAPSDVAPADAAPTEGSPHDATPADTHDAAQPDGSVPSDLRVAVLADLNGSYGSTTYGSAVHDAVDALVTRVHPDIVLVAGDMVAGQKAGLDYAAMWAAFHDAVTTPLVQAGIPVAVTPGNHDASAYSGFEAERAEFAAQWTDPSRMPAVTFVDATDFPFRYSFVFRGTFFLSLDATRVGGLGASQRDWVAQQLDAAQPFPTRLVFGHVPLRAVGEGVEDEVLGDDALEATFATRGISAYISGHHHAFYPGVTAGVLQRASGCLGAGPNPVIGSSTTSARSFLLVDVHQGAFASADAWAAPDFDTAVARNSLPTSVTYDGHTLVRDDLAQP